MDKKTISNLTAKTTINILNKYLKADANSTSCVILNQPKAPESLQRFKKYND